MRRVVLRVPSSFGVCVRAGLRNCLFGGCHGRSGKLEATGLVGDDSWTLQSCEQRLVDALCLLEKSLATLGLRAGESTRLW